MFPLTECDYLSSVVSCCLDVNFMFKVRGCDTKLLIKVFPFCSSYLRFEIGAILRRISDTPDPQTTKVM